MIGDRYRHMVAKEKKRERDSRASATPLIVHKDRYIAKDKKRHALPRFGNAVDRVQIQTHRKRQSTQRERERERERER